MKAKKCIHLISLLLFCSICLLSMTGNSSIANAEVIKSKSIEVNNQDGVLNEIWSSEDMEPEFQDVDTISDYLTENGDGTETFSMEASGNQLTSAKLSGQNLKLYNALKTEITKIAKGSSNKTAFTVSPSKILGKKTFTEKDLGVTIYDESKGTWGNDVRIEDAIYDLTKYSLSKVLYSLMADCPYELYWFDKTVGIFAAKPGSYYLSSENGGTITIEDEYIFRFAISKSYANTSSDKFKASDKTYYLTTKTSKITAANEAVARADALVKSCAKLSDYDKIIAYSDYILDAVSYNFDARDSDDYGDPWQMIYVFDENSKTNVVCEGYSKAMQYLCSKTSWDSPCIDCRLVSGLTYYDGDYTNHMWNIIHMPRSTDYTSSGGTFLLDLTNSDSESIGSDRSLFLAPTSGGSVSDGYKFDTSVGDVYYYYLTPSKSAYTTGQLSISTGHYTYKCTEGHTLITHEAVQAEPGKNGKTEEVLCKVCGYKSKSAKTIYAPETIQFSNDSGSYTYTGKVRHPVIKVLNSKGSEIDSSYYKITWPSSGNYTNPGSYKVKVTFREPDSYSSSTLFPYSGSFSATFKIIPKGTKLISTAPGSNKITLIWEKQTDQTSGYQIQVSDSYQFTKIIRTITISGRSVNKRVVDNLKRDKKYYFRIRTYKLVNEKKYYSKWSGYRSDRTK